ncbi:MAG: site-specific integrase [Actinomycetota bacterium]
MPERRQQWKTGFATLAEANAALTKALGKVDTGRDPFPADVTFGRYTDAWLANEAARIRPATLVRYRGLLHKDVLPILADIPLVRIKPAHVRQVLSAMEARKLAAATIRQGRAVLGSIMRQAVEDDLIVANPVIAVRPPANRRRDLTVPTAAQLSAMMTAAKGSTYEVPLTLACGTGARRSEILGLQWSDFDAKRGTLRITRSLQRGPGSDQGRDLRVLPPKTPRAVRELKLPAFAVELLRAHRRAQTDRQLKLGAGWFKDQALGELICERGDGGPIDPDNLTQAFKRYAKAAGLDQRTRLHDVRHAVATKLAEDGVPLVAVSALLGHSSAAFTASVYQHAFTTMTDQAAAALDVAFGG